MTWTIEYAESVRKPIAKLVPQARKKIRPFLEGRIANSTTPVAGERP